MSVCSARYVFGSRRGQAAVEFLLVMAVVLAAVAVLAVLLVASREHGGRTLDLVAADVP